MRQESTRREFLQQAAAVGMAAGLGAASAPGWAADAKKRTYDISIAAWSFHRTIGKSPGQRPFLDLPAIAKQDFGITGIELVSQMMAASDKAYVDALAKNASDNGVRILLTMVDNEGNIGAKEEARRAEAVTRHQKWVDITADLGGHSIRMNWGGARPDTMKNPAELEDLIKRSVPHFQALCDYADKKGLNVIIENHGGPSSYPAAMEQLMKAVGHPRFGTLPDFGNFPPDVDKYDGIDRLMAFAKAVSAKCYDFDDTTGLETKLDFPRLIEICCDKHGYAGYIGIEYEGDRLDEFEGVRRCKALLDKLRG